MNFPRGSDISLTGSTRSKTKTTTSHEPSQKRSRQKPMDENASLVLLKHQISSTKMPFVDVLSKKKLHHGMLFTGVVTELFVNNDGSMHMKISLPYGMTTTIIISQSNPGFHNASVSEGDKIRVAYNNDASNPFFTMAPEFTQPHLPQQLETLDDGTLLLSTPLSVIIKSIEDHGYLLSFGTHVSKVGFLPFKQNDIHSSSKYPIGTLLPTVFVSESIVKQDKSIIPCTLSPSQSPLPSKIQFFDFNFFAPGMLLSGSIVQIIPNRGYVVSILSGAYYAILDLMHCRQNYNLGEEIVAHVLYTCVESKTIGLTVLQHLDHKNTSVIEPNKFSVGQLINSKVIRVDQFYGLLLQAEDDSCIPSLYLHITKLMKKRITAQDFPIGMSLQVCVTRIDHCDGLFQVCQYKIDDDTNTLIGTIVKGLVINITEKSIVAQIHGTKIIGICPKFHWSESKNNACSMQKDKKYRFRILSALDSSLNDDHNEHIGIKVLLTRKTSLIESLLPPLHSPDQLLPTLRKTAFYDVGTHGFVVAIKNDGVIVAFYGSMKGYLPKSQMISSPLELGNVVHVRVVQCIDMDTGKYILTMLPRKTTEHDKMEKKKSLNVENNALFVDEIEKQLLSEPNNSALWIQYMSEWTSRGDLDKSREIANRALHILPYHDEKERLIIWSAWLHMEWHVMIGTFGNIVITDSQLDIVIKDALQRAHEKRILLILWEMYWKTFTSQSVNSLARERIQLLIPIMLSKLKQSCKIHVFIWHYYISDHLLEEADKQYHSSYNTLFNYPGKQLKYATKVGCISYRSQQKERGRTIFETLVSQYPKRFDIWIVYIQAEESSDPGYVRRLYERALGLKFSSKKMKTLFKMYLSYEKLHGNQKGVDHVQDLVRQYVDSDTMTS